jgi:hypothetical protein
LRLASSAFGVAVGATDAVFSAAGAGATTTGGGFTSAWRGVEDPHAASVSATAATPSARARGQLSANRVDKRLSDF